MTEEKDAVQIINVNAPCSVAAPNQFDFVPEHWNKWRKRFERYLSVSDSANKTEKDKIDTLLYLMGEKAEDLAIQLNINSTETDTQCTLAEALQKIEDYFTPKRNPVYSRFKFNTRKQEPGESVDEFIRELHVLAEVCDFKEFKEQMIRDKVVVGVLSKKAREKMLLHVTLTLEQAVQIAKNVEDFELNQSSFSVEDKEINKVGVSEKQCWFCGRQMHKTRQQCPALRSRCLKCTRIGHFARCCKGGQIGQAKEENAGIVRSKVCLLNGSKYKVRVGVYREGTFKSNVTFLIDTGADIVAIPEELVANLASLVPCSINISGPDDTKLIVKGKLNLVLTYEGEQYCGDVYVVKNLKTPILGVPALEAMKIIQIKGINSITNESQVNVEKEFPKLFDELGVFKEPFSIQLVDQSKSYIQCTPRVVPIPLLDKVKNELDRLCELGVMTRVEEPTQYVSPVVVVPKEADKIRICGDYTELNKNILRPIFPIPKVEVTLALLEGSKFFSKLDATAGFHQIQLTEESARLTTIITPFGRYMYTRLPFGLNCAPEYFSMKFSQLFEGIKGVVTHVDDILVHANSIEEHDKILRQVLHRLNEKGITINKSKCVFGVKEVHYLGHIINSEGIQVDPKRIEAITNFEVPKSKKQVMKFLGMINYMARFIENKTEVLQPLYMLLRKENVFLWGQQQQMAFENVKKKLQQAPILAHYNPKSKIIIGADSSSYGLGATLMQENQDKSRNIVAYASRTLNDTEKRYLQIEKECLALTWAVERFKDYVYGIKITLETDHKPLLQILQTKHIDELTPRLMSFRMRLTRFNYTVCYIPGKKLIFPDALSRNPIVNKDNDDTSENSSGLFINAVLQNIPLKDQLLADIKLEQSKCFTCKKIMEFCQTSWPNQSKLTPNLKQYYQYRFDLCVVNDILLYKSRIVVPTSLQLHMLNKIHEGHLGITKCRGRAKQTVWWLGMATQIEKLIQSCPQCIEQRGNYKEDILLEKQPMRAWQKIGIDLFYHNNTWYMVIIDFYSRYLEVKKMNSITEHNVIEQCKDIFSKFGIPELVRTDCGTQFKSKFKQFAKQYNFEHITSSPYYSQSNGCAESAVKIAKNLLKKNEDIHMALLIYRNTPLEFGYSPAELMFRRKLRDNLPRLPEDLQKTVYSKLDFEKKESKKKEKIKQYYNKRHRTRKLRDLSKGEKVWIIDLKEYGTVVRKAPEPRSYIVSTVRGLFRRNRWHLIPSPHIKDVSLPSYCHSDNVSKYKGDKERCINEGSNDCVPKLLVPQGDRAISDAPNIVLDDKISDNCDSNLRSENDSYVQEETLQRSQRKRMPPKWLADYVT